MSKRRKNNKNKSIEKIVQEAIEETTDVDNNINDSEKKVDDVLETNEDSIVEENSESEMKETEKTDDADAVETEENSELDEVESEDKTKSDETEVEDKAVSDESETEEDKSEEKDKPDESDSSDTPVLNLLSDIGSEEAYVDKSLVEQAAKKAQKKQKIKKICKITGISLASTAVLAYFIISVWFMFHYNRNTYINDIDMSFHSTEDARNIINEFIDNYSLTIYLREGDSHTIKPSDINMQIVPTFDEMDAKHEQNGLLWPFFISNEKRYTITYSVSYDETLLDALLSNYDCMQKENMVAAKNAYVTVEKGQSVVVEETLGTVVDFDAVKAEICNALDLYTLEIDLNDNPCYYEADITSDSEEIAEIKSELDHYLDMVITYHIDEITWDLDGSTFGEWLHYYNGSWHFSNKKAELYVEGLAEKYNSVGTTRNFKTYHGNTVQEYGPRYGWTIDQEAEKEGLLADLQAGVSVDRTPEFSQKGAAYNKYNDIGNTYIEVDLSNQHVYVTIDGTMVFDTACVTGCVVDGHGTPSGLYEIAYMESPSILRGEDYESYVSYWMPFNRGIGLHDATWRGSFGGSIYYSSGSHGCVNLPFSAAQTIYRNYAYPGMPVICYY